METNTKTEEYEGSTPLKSIMQERFINNLISGFPQYEAYQKAGYKTKNDGSAMTCSTLLLQRNAKVKTRLAYKRAELAKKYEVNEERITKERVKIGFANIQDFMDEKGQIKSINKVDRDKLAAVSSIELDEVLGTVKKFRFHDKQEALDKLSRQLGLYEKDNQQRAALTLVDILAIVGVNKEVKAIESKAATG